MKILLILVSFLFLTKTDVVHQDTPLQIDKNGDIIGLPKEFGNAKFDSKKKYLRINYKEIIFPHCISRYFNIHENPKLNLSASWYHSKEIMPYYLNFDISEKNKDYSYSVLVDLETLELIYINISIEQGDSMYFHKIELDERCLVEYKERIKKLN